MADAEPQIADDSAGENPSGLETNAAHSHRPAATHGSAGLHGPGKRSGITWWEACGGWSSRYSLSL